VDGSTHKQVVDLIKSGGDYLTLVVIAMPCDEINRTASDTAPISDNDSTSNNSSTDYSERHTIPIRIVDWSESVDSSGNKYIVYNINYSNKYLCSKRYKEFDTFQSLLRREFSDFQFPHFPRKWPFRLSDNQLEARKDALEVFLVTVCSVRVIYDTDLVRDFLNIPAEPELNVQQKKQDIIRSNEIESEKKSGGSSSISYDFLPSSKEANGSNSSVISKAVSLEVGLPDKGSVTLSIVPNATADQVYQELVKEVGLEERLAGYFYLFEIIDEAFGKCFVSFRRLVV
jgi:sorting nexin-27